VNTVNDDDQNEDQSEDQNADNTQDAADNRNDRGNGHEENDEQPSFGRAFESGPRRPLPWAALRGAALWLEKRPVAGLGVRALRRTEHACWRMLRERLDRAQGSPADPLGLDRHSEHVTLPSDIFDELLQSSRGTNQQAIEDDFYVRILRQLNPSQARILVLMADGSAWPMVHVYAGTLVTQGECVLSYASSVGKEAGVLLREQVPYLIAHMHSLGLLAIGSEDKDNERAYEVLEADTVVRRALLHVTDDMNETPNIERCTIRLSDFGQALCGAALPDSGA